MNDLHSALAQPIADFLHYKQALNKKYQTETLALRLFDRYLFEQGITGWQAITSSVIDAFMASRTRHRPRSYNHLLGVLRRFFDWVVLQRWINQNPVVQRSKRETNKRERLHGQGEALLRHRPQRVLLHRIPQRGTAGNQDDLGENPDSCRDHSPPGPLDQPDAACQQDRGGHNDCQGINQ